MIFTKPVESRLLPSPSGRKPARALRRPLIGGEDGARRALGTDHGPAGPAFSEPSLEHLARIALG